MNRTFRTAVVGAIVATTGLAIALPAAAAERIEVRPGAPIYSRATDNSAVVGTINSGDRIFAVCRRPEEVPPGSFTYGDFYYRIEDATNRRKGWVFERDLGLRQDTGRIPSC